MESALMLPKSFKNTIKGNSFSFGKSKFLEANRLIK